MHGMIKLVRSTSTKGMGLHEFHAWVPAFQRRWWTDNTCVALAGTLCGSTLSYHPKKTCAVAEFFFFFFFSSHVADTRSRKKKAGLCS